MRSELRFRQIHLDFHTSEHIPGIGSEFDPDQFVSALKTGNVNSVTVFARGHHGWSYYPTKVAAPHPNLERPDLLGDMVKACRKADINVPIYITVQWDELTARTHPEWRVMDAHNRAQSKSGQDDSAMNQLTAAWHTICLNHPEYVDYVTNQALEVIELYKPDGLFMDIVGLWECVCPQCLARMSKRGLDPEKSADRLLNHREVVFNYYKTITEAVWAKDPDMRIFHNSGHIYKGERDRYNYFSHLELESLPTGGWGYDHFPVSARYAATLGKEFLGMSGKFHTMWGEFGGYKRPVALEYECAAMVAHGARCSIGDQLHPNGTMDEETYRTIGPAYKRVSEIEEYAKDAAPVSDIAIFSAEANSAGSADLMQRDNKSDDGAARMLLELHHMFDVIDMEEDFSKYQVIICPDTITLTPETAAKIKAYVAGGGKLVLSGASGMNPEETAFALDLPVTYSGRRSEFNPDYIKPIEGLDRELVSSPFVAYQRAYEVKAANGAGANGTSSTGAGTVEVLAAVHLPYFNRSYKHFCSHQHTPPKAEPTDRYDAVIRSGNIIYFSHPIFTDYYNTGQPLLKYLFRGALDLLLPQPRVTTNLPSNGRLTLMRQPEKNRTLLHLLYAQTQLRGNDHTLPNGQSLKIEIIEDVLPIYGITCTVKTDKVPRKVYLGASGKELEFKTENGTVTFTVEKLYIHEVVVME